jgi:hypothetical protein
MDRLREVKPLPAYRRLTGLTFGALLGLAFGLLPQLPNRIALPGIPLYQPPLGPMGNIALAVLGGALLGLISAWPEGSFGGIALASILSAILIAVGNLIQARPAGNQLMAVPIITIFLSFVLWGMLMPLIAAIRWGVNKLVAGHIDRTPIVTRLTVPALVVLAVGLVAASRLYRGEARFLLARTHALLQEGQAAAGAGALPEAFRAPDVGPFVERAKGDYTLAWERSNIERYRIPRPGKNFDNHSAVVARFKDGWNLVCLYVTPEDVPLCKGFEELPK